MFLQVHGLKRLTDELDEIKNMKNVKVSFHLIWINLFSNKSLTISILLDSIAI